MKKISRFGIFICAIFFMSFQQETKRYYYAYSEKIPIQEIEGKVIIRYDREFSKNKALDSIQKTNTEVNIIPYDKKTILLSYTGFAPKKNKDVLVQAGADARATSLQPLFMTIDGQYLAITDEIVVKFKDNIREDSVKIFNAKYQVTIIQKDGSNYLLRVAPKSDALNIANIYQESGLTIFAHPNFLSKATRFGTNITPPEDEYFSQQFALQNIGQSLVDNHTGKPGADIAAIPAWGISKGSPDIVIAVLDEGVTNNHPDLPGSRQKRVKGSNFADGNPDDPSPHQNQNHGNGCAGLIAATHNNEGIAGIAPLCRIMPIRVFNTDETPISNYQFAQAIRLASSEGADIISCSWGFDLTYPKGIPVIVDAILEVTTKGRKGKGCVVVFAASNSANHLNGRNGMITFPANVQIKGVLTVGASDRDDLQANYSPSGNPLSKDNQQIDIVAPSHKAYPEQSSGKEMLEIWTIDIPDQAGLNPSKEPSMYGPVPGEQMPGKGKNYLSYSARFGGTSAACPLVAGVAALILSQNNKLTQEQVFDILTSQADKIGHYTYTNGHSNETGFGRLNAWKALQNVPNK